MKLTELKTNKSAVIDEIDGGEEIKHRLESLGIIKGKEIIKISSHFWRGPITIRFKSAKNKVAIGHGMAEKIKVKEVNG